MNFNQGGSNSEFNAQGMFITSYLSKKTLYYMFAFWVVIFVTPVLSEKHRKHILLKYIYSGLHQELYYLSYLLHASNTTVLIERSL